MPPVPPLTPPQTQPPPAFITTNDAAGTDLFSNSIGDAKQHEQFYETRGSLLDLVILKVKHELAATVWQRILIPIRLKTFSIGSPGITSCLGVSSSITLSLSPTRIQLKANQTSIW